METPYYTVKQFAIAHPAFSSGALRALIFHSKDRNTTKFGFVPSNGMEASGAIIFLGRRVLINEQAFFKWLDKHGQSIA